MKRFAVLLAFTAPVLFSALFSARIAPAAEPTVEQGITYAVRNGEELKLDLAVPGDAGTMRPAVLFIHGGGWAEGNRDAYTGAIRELAHLGFVAATASYRFTNKAPWPAQLEDVRAAAAWLRANSAKYGLDPRRLGAIGHSAGGHLSLMLGTTPAKEGDEGPCVQAVVNFFGPTDMRTDVFNDFVDGLLEKLAGGKREVKAAIYADFSPLVHVSPSTAPTLTFQGTVDPLVPVEQARLLHAALDKARVPNRVRILEGQGHGWGGELAETTKNEAVKWFETYLRGSDLPLLLAEDFEAGAERWKPTNAAAWKVGERGGRKVYSIVKRTSDYSPPVRSPLNIALLEGKEAGDLQLDVLVRSTVPDYDHRDVCLVFGYRDPSHFYYAHLAKKADEHANSIFIVNGKPRETIARERTEGTAWDDGWHRLRVRREEASGKTEVFFDDLEKPVMRAEDKTFPRGRVGIGSFDDTADFAEVRLRGK